MAMKVTGPGSGLPPVTPGAENVDAAGPARPAAATEIEKTEASAFAEKLRGTTGVASTGTAPAVASAGDPAALAAALDSGRLGAREAAARLVETVIDRQLGSLGADAPPALREKLRTMLGEALESDPLLQQKLRALTAGVPS